MKTTTAILLSIFAFVKMEAQCKQEYKSLEWFHNDVTAFVMYNFYDRGDCYIDRIFSDFIHDLGMPIDNISLLINKNNPDEVHGITVNVYDEEITNQRIKLKQEPHNIRVYFESPIPRNEFTPFVEKNTKNIKWNWEIKALLAPKLILATRTHVYSYSRYYESYSKKN